MSSSPIFDACPYSRASLNNSDMHSLTMTPTNYNQSSPAISKIIIRNRLIFSSMVGAYIMVLVTKISTTGRPYMIFGSPCISYLISTNHDSISYSKKYGIRLRPHDAISTQQIHVHLRLHMRTCLISESRVKLCQSRMKIASCGRSLRLRASQNCTSCLHDAS